MCFGSKKSSAPAPAPIAPVTAANAMPDTSNQQRMAATMQPQPAAFGSELGTSGSMTPTTGAQ